MKRCAFYTAQPVVSRKNALSPPLRAGRRCAPPRVSPFSMVKRPDRSEPMSLCASRLLPGAGGRSPARRGAWGERGRPLYTPCTPVLPFLRERGRSLLNGAVPRPSRVAWGVGADLPGPSCRVMSAPAAALRPPFGRTGSPSRPRHRCIKSKGRRGCPSQATEGRKPGGWGSAGRRQE